ncbi:hypothetical protein O6H91_01G151700 [Diphasiastrum complanatum]|uniref:Uncharacterized protein n=1 Tax=Diphasiastrum complanatum TaxID=34168 RepID=A0ACC2EXH3_DIPCM|nr:hypothetical protein O6H91_01G151700 [Diphasiastrum complanatum]
MKTANGSMSTITLDERLGTPSREIRSFNGSIDETWGKSPNREMRSPNCSLSVKDVDERWGAPTNEKEPQRKGNFWTATAFIITANAGTWSLISVVDHCTTGLDTWTPGSVNFFHNNNVAPAPQRALGLERFPQHALKSNIHPSCTYIKANSETSIGRSLCIRVSPLQGTSACEVNSGRYTIVFGGAQLILAQIPRLRRVGWLSMVSATTSFGYSFILLEDDNMKLTYLWTGLQSVLGNMSTYQEVVGMLQAVGIIAYSYGFTSVLIEVQDTLKSPPVEYKTMTQATSVGISISTFFYLAVSCVGYAAFGKNSSKDLLTGFGTLNNEKMCVHLICEYVESRFFAKWPRTKFWNYEGVLNCMIFGKTISVKFSFFRIAWRFLFVVATTTIAMLFPFFNNVIGLWGSLVYWPIAVYFPIEMHIAQFKIPAGSAKWIGLKCLSFVTLTVFLGCIFASVKGIIFSLDPKNSFSI